MTRYLVSGFLALCVIASALAVVLVQHERLDLFVELRQMERERDQMEIEWDQLRLERSALTANDQVMQVARERLTMHVPEADSIVLVVP